MASSRCVPEPFVMMVAKPSCAARTCARVSSSSMSVPGAVGTWISATTFGGTVTFIAILPAALSVGATSHFQCTEIVPRMERYVAPNDGSVAGGRGLINTWQRPEFNGTATEQIDQSADGGGKLAASHLVKSLRSWMWLDAPEGLHKINFYRPKHLQKATMATLFSLSQSTLQSKTSY